MMSHRRLWISLVGCLGLLCMLCLCSLVFTRMAFPAYKLVGQNMEPALHAGDLVWANPWAYRQRLPARGDVIVFRRSEGQYSYSRVIGLPGEQVAILNEKVFIDGTPLAESYIDQPTRSGGGDSVTLSEHEVFVLGDNRNQSVDSRSSGPVSLDSIVGKVVFALSPDRIHLMPRVSYPPPGTVP